MGYGKQSWLVSATFAALSGGAWAQEAETQANVSTGLSEVVVTAQRREQSLQDTPLAVSAVNAEQLQARSIFAFEDLESVSPSLTITQGSFATAAAAQPIIYIRGIGQNDPTIAADPGVGVYVDGIYVARSAGASLDLPDIERVEVLRGPQGTLFGRNATGGAVSITTTRPGAEPSFSADVTYGTDNLAEVRGVGMMPFNEELSGKLSLLVRQQDGYGTRFDPVTLGQTGELGGIDRLGARGALYWDHANGSVALSADYSRNQDDPAPRDFRLFSETVGLVPAYNALVGFPQGTPLTIAGLPPGQDDSFGLGPSMTDQEVWGVSLTAQLEFDGAELRSISGYRHVDGFFAYDIDTMAATFADQSVDLLQEQISQEVQLLGQSFDSRLEWILGAYYLREDATERTQGAILGGLYTALEALPGAFVPVAPGAVCPGDPFCAGGPGNPLNVLLDASFDNTVDQTTSSYALYAQGTYALSSTLSLTGGLRYTYDEKQFDLASRKIESGFVQLPLTRREEDWEALTPRIGLEWRPIDDTMLYANATRGFKSGGFNGRAYATAGLNGFDPEFVTSYELGARTTAFDGRLRLGAATFLSEYEDIQLTRTITDPVSGSFTVETVNVAAAEIAGFELDAEAVPVEGLSINLGLGYLHTEITEVDAPIVTVGDQLPRAPEWTLSAGVQYAIDTPLATITPRLDYSYRSESFNDEINSDSVKSPSSSVWDARISFERDGTPWRLALWGRNITDERYITFGADQSSNGVTVVQYSRPAEYGVTLSARF